MKRFRVTMQIIADELGVTKVTVSKALNNQPGVSQELRKSILDVAHKLGYRAPGQKSYSPSNNQTRNFLFLVAKRFFVETDRFYTNIFYYLSRICSEGGHTLSLRIIDFEEEQRVQHPYGEFEASPDGFFIAGEMDELYLKSLQHLGIPVIAIDFFKPHLLFDCVIMDNFYASYMATQYLIDQGHVQIGFVGNPEYSASVADRYYGYLKALAEYHLPYREEWHLSTNDDMGVYYTELDLPPQLPSAFVCHCDMAAYHLMLVLQRYGVDVPGTVSLMSFDNTVLSQNSIPPLTTIDIDTGVMAGRAFEQMIWRINNQDAPCQRIILSANILIRASVSAYPQLAR